MAEFPFKKPCLDSSVFIAGIEGEIVDGIKRDVIFRSIWAAAKAGQFKLYMSAIAIAEVYKMKYREMPSSGTLVEFIELINEPFVTVIEVDRETALHAHHLCQEYANDGLMPNDAMHLACALRAGCDYLLAWDRPLGYVNHPSILIKEPFIGSYGMFEDSEIATPEEIKAHQDLLAKRRLEKKAEGNRAERSAYNLKLQEGSDRFADEIVTLQKQGCLSSTFDTREVRKHFNGHPESHRLDTILADYCSDGKMVLRGSAARFTKMSRGRYAVLVTNGVSDDKNKNDIA